MRIAEKIFLESVKPGISSLVANAYAESSLAGEPMVAFAGFMEIFKAKLPEVGSLSDCLQLLDDSMAVSFDTSWQADSPQKFRTALLSYFQGAYAAAIDNYSTTCEVQSLQAIIAIFLEWVFAWRLVLAKDFVVQHKERLDSRPDDVPDLAYYAKLMERRRWVEVMPMAESLIASDWVEDLNKARLHTMLADILLHWIGNRTKARKHINHAWEFSDSLGYTYDISARIALDEGNNEEALTQLNHYKERFPNDVQPYLSLGIYYEKQEDFTRAIQLYDGILQQHPGHTSTLHQKLQLGYLLYPDFAKRKDFINATTSLLLYLDPESPYDIIGAAGSAFEKAKDYSDAEICFRSAIERDTLRPEGYNLLGVMRAKQIRETENVIEKETFQKEAEELHAKSISLAPAHFDGYWSLILLLQQVRDYPRAIEVLKQALVHCTSFSRLIHMQQVYLYQDLQELDAANEELLLAVADKEINDNIDRFVEDAVGFYKNYLQENKDKLDVDALSGLLHLIDSLEKAEATLGKELWYRLRVDAFLSLHKTAPEFLPLLREATIQFPATEYFHQELIKQLADNPSLEVEKKEALEKAFYLFPDAFFFKEEIRRQVFGFTHEYVAAPRPLYIDFDAAFADLILKPDTNEFLPAFMEEIEGFRVRMKEVYGLAIPGLQFRAYETTNEVYDYYLTIDEVIVVAGKKFRHDALLVNGDRETLEALGITIESLASHDLMHSLHWVPYEDIETLSKEGIEALTPEHLIFFQLEFFILQHAARFIRLEDEDMRHVLEGEDVETAAKFLELLQTLVSCRAPIFNKEALLLRMKLGLQRSLSITQIASDILADSQYQPLVPGWLQSKAGFKVSEGIQHTLHEAIGTLESGEWYLKIIPQDCQEILAALRFVEPLGNEKVLLKDDRAAWALSTMAKLEFPYLQLVTEKYPDVPSPEELTEITTV